MILDLPTPPINEYSKKIDQRYYEDLVIKSQDSRYLAEAYARQIPNVRQEAHEKPISARMARFKKAGLTGCFNNTGVDSTNYKDFLYGSTEKDIDS